MQKSFLGTLMLDTQFERILGDVGNTQSYPCKAITSVVEQATTDKIVQGEPLPKQLVERFTNAAINLEAKGAFALVSSCGFLVSIQQQIAAAVNIPVMLSALSLYDDVKAKLDQDQKIAVITASKVQLSDYLLQAANIERSQVIIIGMDECTAFVDVILNSHPHPHLADNKVQTTIVEQYVVTQALEAIQQEGSIGAFILECGNLPPYAAAITKATNKPVFSILDAVNDLKPQLIRH